MFHSSRLVSVNADVKLEAQDQLIKLIHVYAFIA